MAWAYLQNAPKRVYVDFDEVLASGSKVTICENVPVASEHSHDYEKKAMTKDRVSKRKKDAVKKSDDIIKGTKRKTESKEKKAKKAKEKDPNAPKRPSTGFMIFMQSFRKTYKEANPESKGVAAAAKAAGERWKQMTDEEKAPYNKDAAARKVTYEQAVTKYKNAGSSKDDGGEASKAAAAEDEEGAESVEDV